MSRFFMYTKTLKLQIYCHSRHLIKRELFFSKTRNRLFITTNDPSITYTNRQIGKIFNQKNLMSTYFFLKVTNHCFNEPLIWVMKNIPLNYYTQYFNFQKHQIFFFKSISQKRKRYKRVKKWLKRTYLSRCF